MDYQVIDNFFPSLLPNPPARLFFKGNFNQNLIKDCVAVVGSRKMTDYGQRVIEKIIPQLVAQKKTVVSGFMYGVDQYAHKLTVESGGKTIAVLGWGISQKLTGDDKKLAEQILESGGALISEWEDQKATHWTFPLRNRIIVAISDEVIVVEAAQKSGSLITAKIAAKLKKKLWAVPGPITSRQSEGTNALIASGAAQMWLGEVTVLKLNFDDPILQILSNEALTADELSRKLKVGISEIGMQLSMLLLGGQILEKNGKYYLTDEVSSPI